MTCEAGCGNGGGGADGGNSLRCRKFDGTLLEECCDPGRVRFVGGGRFDIRRFAGRLATVRWSLLAVPEVFGRPSRSLWGRGPSFFFGL